MQVSSETAFEAGRLKVFRQQWEDMTSDPLILTMIGGVKIPTKKFHRKISLNQDIRYEEICGKKQTGKLTNNKQTKKMGVIKKAVHADTLSRKFKNKTGCKLNENVFKNLTAVWGTLTVDLFA